MLLGSRQIVGLASARAQTEQRPRPKARGDLGLGAPSLPGNPPLSAAGSPKLLGQAFATPVGISQRVGRSGRARRQRYVEHQVRFHELEEGLLTKAGVVGIGDGLARLLVHSRCFCEYCCHLGPVGGQRQRQVVGLQAWAL